MTMSADHSHVYPSEKLMYLVEPSAFRDCWRLKLLVDGVEVGGGFYHGDEGHQEACEAGREWLDRQLGVV